MDPDIFIVRLATVLLKCPSIKDVIYNWFPFRGNPGSTTELKHRGYHSWKVVFRYEIQLRFHEINFLQQNKVYAHHQV